MTHRMHPWHTLTFTAVTLALLLGGCPPFTPTPPGSDDPGPARLKPFESANDLLVYFRQQAQTSRDRDNYGLGRGVFGLPLAAPGAAEDGAGVDDQAGGTDAGATDEATSFSATNLQEVGVDESDIFKTDGEFFYIAGDQTLHIVQAEPAADLAEVAQLTLDLAYIAELYLSDDTLIALGPAPGDSPGDEYEDMSWPPYDTAARLRILQLDVSDPANPVVTHQTELDGGLATSRLIGDRLIVVLTVQPSLPEVANAITLGRMTLDEILPKVRRANATDEAIPWERWLRPETPDGYGMTAVLTIDATNIETLVGSTAVLANAGTIYASPQALYLTDTTYDGSYSTRPVTAIHKFTFDDEGIARYTASGYVPGRLLNQFSLGEHEGYLRVATHITDWAVFGDVFVGVAMVDVPVADTAEAPAGSDDDAVARDDEQTQQDDTSLDDVAPPYNGVYVLGENAGALEIVGAVEKIAPNERIYAARFLGSRGFLVTFRQIDPLFVLDLSTPTEPAILGELKIPGYSEYLHPVGDTHLIGVGRSVEVIEPAGFSEPGAVQLSLFDVSDWANPMLVQQIEVGGAHSQCDVSDTHKAFTYMDETQQLALPVRLTPDGTSWFEWDDFAFQGVVCYDVDLETGFIERGRVASINSNVYWYSSWQRAAFIGDHLYAVTPEGVRAAALDGFAVTAEVLLTNP